MNAAQKLQQRVDRFQQDRPVLGYALGAWKKFGDDQAGYLAALVSYYAFASIFPLLLVFYTVLQLVLRNNVQLQHKLYDSALSQYPIIGQNLHHKTSVTGAGVALAIGLVLTFYGARGVAAAIQNALNTVWGVPFHRRPGFPKSLLRSFALIIVIGVGQIVTVTLSGLAGGTGHLVPGVVAHVGAIVVALLLNVGVFWLSFRVGTAKEIATRDLRLGAIIAGTIWTVLQFFGSYVLSHAAKTTSGYGIFGTVLGLLAVFYLQAQLTLYAVEFNVVRVRRLWPRSLFPPPLTDADVRAYQLYAAAGQHRPEFVVELRRADQAGDGPAAPEPEKPPRAAPPGAAGPDGGPGPGGGPGPDGGRDRAAPRASHAAAAAASPRVLLAGRVLSALAVLGAMRRRKRAPGHARK